MKIRTGFVSNSSSASFVIRWKTNVDMSTQLDNITKEDRISLSLMDVMDTGRMDIEDISKKTEHNQSEEYDGYDNMLRHLFRNTKEIDKVEDIYETSFWTSMHNCSSDFGRYAAYLVLALELSTTAEKISMTIKHDN